MRTIETSVQIAADSATVWDILVDLERYADWNSFIPRAEGAVRVGGTVRLFIRPPGGRGMTHRPTIVVAEPGRRLQWLGNLPVPGLLSARHEFLLEGLSDGGTRLRHREEFRGLVVALLGRTLRRVEAGFVAMNGELRQRAERG